MSGLAAAASLVACLLLGAPTRAQGEGEPDPIAKRIDKAIADYERVRQNKTKLPQRRRLIGWLGEIDHPRVSTYLKKELAAFRKWGFGVAVVDAIARLPRPTLETDLRATLRHRSTSYIVRVAAARAMLSLGDAQADRLIELAGGSDKELLPAGRNAAMEALAKSGSSRLQRELAPADRRW